MSSNKVSDAEKDFKMHFMGRKVHSSIKQTEMRKLKFSMGHITIN